MNIINHKYSFDPLMYKYIYKKVAYLLPALKITYEHFLML